jgi:flagellar protein FlaG
MNPSHPQPKIELRRSADYRETYANSVQIRASVWDFLLNFGVAHQNTPDQVTVDNNYGVYLSPQQAKALWNMLGQNLAQYEQAFGTIAIEPHGPAMPAPGGPVH